MKKALIILYLLVSMHGVFAQMYSNLRLKFIEVSDSVCIDSLSIVPSSFKLYLPDGSLVDEHDYTLFFDRSVLRIDKPQNELLFRAEYRVFSINFSGQFPKVPPFDFTSDAVNALTIPNVAFADASTNVVEEPRIQATGNISRGISAGNGQNMVLNSNLNLQLTGKVDDNISVEAVLSDKNIPVQPNGYTQQINAFDQIYIRIYDSLRYLQMGDVDVSASNSYFLKFQRRLQGGDFGAYYDVNKNIKSYSKATAAIAKGIFNRSTFMGIEGIQGPYPLFGVNNERFIVVLAGSERVYVDGALLQRGEKADYVMNYNTAQLTFMPNVLITKDSRIIVEFEYSDRNYNRFLAYGQTELSNEKSKVGVQFFSEGDAKNQPVNQMLSDEQKRILSMAGDNPYDAVVPNVDSVAFDINKVLYAMVDTVVNNVSYDSVFKVSFNKDSAMYQLGFALVGEGNGHYILQPSSANGKVYQWVAPVLGVLQGNYEPIQMLIAPKKQQMVVFSVDHQFENNSGLSIETAFSNKDLNTFSSLDAANNKGLAIKSTAYHVFDLNALKLKSYGGYEYVHKNFNEVERYRGAEFNRDWNLTQPFYADQHLLSSGLGFYKRKKQWLDLTLDYLNQTNAYEGFKMGADLNLKFKKYMLLVKPSMLVSDDVLKTTQFYRHRLLFQRSFAWFDAGVGHEMEDNIQKTPGTDSIVSGTLRYNMTEVFAKMPDSLKRTVGITYRNRLDFVPFQNALTHLNTTHDVVLNSKLAQMKNNQLWTSATYRKLELKNEALVSNVRAEDNFLSRIEHQLNLLKRSVSLSTFYEVGTGLEAKQEFVYIEVAPGQGIYVWVDYNANGIPELDEFEISKFPEEANYLRIYTPSNDYQKAYALKFNHTLKIDPSMAWRKSEGYKQILSRFSNSLSFRLVKKQTNDDFAARLNPFNLTIVDASLINNRNSVRNVFSFNRSNPTFGGEWIFNYSTAKNLMVNGFDQSQLSDNQLKFRWNIVPAFLVRNNSTFGSKQFSSEFFALRNYNIHFWSNESVLQWQPDPQFRAVVQYTYSDKTNDWGGEHSQMHEMGPEIKYSRAGKGTIALRIMAINVQYSGSEQSAISYEMLNGFMPGQNYTWNINASQNLNEYLRLSLNYNGRKAVDSPVIHTGQASLTAFF